MVKSRKICTVIALCFALCGCQKDVPQKPRLVTGVHISGIHQDAPVDVFYSQPEKMETILYYLRTLEDLGKPDTDPERIKGDRFKISLQYSDGSHQLYRQQADRFLSRNDHPWYKVDPRKASLLYPLLQSMAADQVSGTMVL